MPAPVKRAGRVIFLVGNRHQWDAASAVRDWLGSDAEIWSLEQHGALATWPLDLTDHQLPVSPQNVIRLHYRISKEVHANDVLVIPQDVGALYRTAVAAARRGNARVALMPDGAVSQARVSGRAEHTPVADLLDATSVRVGLLAGKNGLMGASRPDLCLSWGPGWKAVWRARGVSQVVVVGSPADDCLAGIAPTMDADASVITIASQPMWHEDSGGSAAERAWYAWLEVIARTATAGRFEIRLHPAESRSALGPAAAKLVREAPLSDAIRRSRAWVSPRSTTLIEAAACGLPVISVVTPRDPKSGARVVEGYPFLQDTRLPRFTTADISDARALELRSTTMPGPLAASYGRDYMSHVGNAAEMAANALRHFLRQNVTSDGVCKPQCHN